MRFRRLLGRQSQPPTQPQTVSATPWRESDVTPQQTAAPAQLPGQARQAEPEQPSIVPTKRAQTVSEIHWRLGDGKQ